MSTTDRSNVIEANEANKAFDQTASLQTDTIVQRSLWMDALRRFRRNRLAMFGLAIIIFLLFLAIFADVLAPYPFDKVFFTVRHPDQGIHQS